VAQTSSSQGSFTALAAGRIVAWWAATGLKGSTGELRVLRRTVPLIQVRYLAVGTSTPDTIDPQATHHDTDLPVAANDLIGITILTGALDHHGDPGTTERFSGVLPWGTAELSDGPGTQTLEYGAEFVFRPIVTTLDTTSGPTTGGGTVTVSGAHLTESTAVLFGSTPGAGMSVLSNSRISVQIPPGSGTVDVTVVGPGGTSLTISATPSSGARAASSR
jgi:hypothetical protein